jgi:hypothetical protein
VTSTFESAIDALPVHGTPDVSVSARSSELFGSISVHGDAPFTRTLPARRESTSLRAGRPLLPIFVVSASSAEPVTTAIPDLMRNSAGSLSTYGPSKKLSVPPERMRSSGASALAGKVVRSTPPTIAPPVCA